jgi:hypothetical protein
MKTETLFLSTDRSLGLLLVNPPEKVVESYKNGRKAKKNYCVGHLEGLPCSFRLSQNPAKGTKCLVADFARRGYIARVFPLGLDRTDEAIEYFYEGGKYVAQFYRRKWIAAVTNGQAHRIGVAFFTPEEDAILIAERKVKEERAETRKMREAVHKEWCALFDKAGLDLFRYRGDLPIMSAATEKALTPSEVTAISVPLMERTRQHIESVLARRQAEAEAKAAAERLAKEAAERAAQEAAKRAEQETRKAVEREAKILAALNMTAEEFAAMTPKSQRIAAHNARLAGKLKD